MEQDEYDAYIKSVADTPFGRRCMRMSTDKLRKYVKLLFSKQSAVKRRKFKNASNRFCVAAEIAIYRSK